MPNMFAGSILDLEPGTEYEARFVLTDPDGVIGKPTRLVTVKTRPEPKPAEGGTVYHVYPMGWKGPKEPNSLTGLIVPITITVAVATPHSPAAPG